MDDIRHRIWSGRKATYATNEDVVVVPMHCRIWWRTTTIFCGERHANRIDIMVNGAPIDFGFRQRCCFCRPGDIYWSAYSKESPDIVQRLAWTYPSSFVNDFKLNRARMRESKKTIKKSMYKRLGKERQFLMVGFEPGRAVIEEEITVRGEISMGHMGKRNENYITQNDTAWQNIVILM